MKKMILVAIAVSGFVAVNTAIAWAILADSHWSGAGQLGGIAALLLLDAFLLLPLLAEDWLP